MAQAQTRTRRPRMTLTRAQRKKIRDWRSELGHAIWDLNESPLVHDLRRQYEIEQEWDPMDMLKFAGGIQKLARTAAKVRAEMSRFVAKAKLPKPYRDRLRSAIDGIEIGIGYLRNLQPGRIRKFIEQHLGEQTGLAEMLFFGFCPVLLLEPTRPMPSGAKLAKLNEQAEILKVRERIAKDLGLSGMEGDVREARQKVERQIRRGMGEEPISQQGGCYINGIKAFRASVTQMFYTLQANDFRKIYLDRAGTEAWHETQRETGSPPPDIVEQMDELANDEGRIVYVMDADGKLLYPAMPLWYTGEDPESLKERAALKQSRRARQQWGYDYRAATPSNTAEFRRSLTKEQQRKVSRFLEHYRDPQTGELIRGFSLEEIAAVTDVPFRSPEEAEFQRRAAAQFARNPGVDWTSEISHDHGLHKALWMMDLGE